MKAEIFLSQKRDLNSDKVEVNIKEQETICSSFVQLRKQTTSSRQESKQAGGMG